MDLVTRLRTAAVNNNVFATRGTDVNKRPLDQERRLQCEAIASMHHEAADEIESLRRALERIASKNDLSAVADADLQTRASVAFGSLAECEMLARNALDD